VSSLGGPEVPAIGFGMGVERVLLALAEPAADFEPTLALFIAVLGGQGASLGLARGASAAHGRRSHRDGTPSGEPEAQLKRADASRRAWLSLSEKTSYKAGNWSCAISAPGNSTK